VLQHLAERVRERRGAGEPLRRILGERDVEHADELRRQIGPLLADRRDLASADLAEDLDVGLAIEQALGGELA